MTKTRHGDYDGRKGKMSLTIESASALLYKMYNSCEERNDKINAEAIEVALECMREIEKQKCKDYFAEEDENND